MQLARPESVEGAVAALSDGKALAGGTELVPLLRDGIVADDTLVDVRAALPRGRRGLSLSAGRGRAYRSREALALAAVRLRAAGWRSPVGVAAGATVSGREQSI